MYFWKNYSSKIIHKMYVNWKSLIVLGIIFWCTMCFKDFLGKKDMAKFSEETMKLSGFAGELPESSIPMSRVKEKASYEFNSKENTFYKAGWSLLVANSVIFVVAFFFCTMIRTIFKIIWRIYNKYSMDKLAASNQPRTSDSSEYFPSHSFIRSSEINLPQKNTKVNSDLSCPNLLLSQKGPQYSSKCQTLFKNRQMFSATAIVEIERPLKSEISKLRAELLRIQSNTLKEQGDLSRRLEGIIKEKRELSKQVCTLLKENKAAKAQLEELGAEKTTLQKRLEFASKEFKANTKTKKVALAKLQEISSQVEDLKKQLERMGRDKEILEGKLEVLRHEYDNLKERFHLYQISVSSHQQVSEKTTAEKPSVEDEKGNTSEDPELARENSKASVLNHSAESDLHLNSNLSKDTIYLPYVISQTEMDMKKIQRKIFALEKNLESFNSSKSDFDKKNSELLAEMDLQTSNRKLAENIIKRSMPNAVTCRKKYEDIKIQMLTNALKDKVKILENIKDKGDESRFSLDDKFEESSSEEAKLEDPLTPGRIVSTSTAFQNFLKTITPS